MEKHSQRQDTAAVCFIFIWWRLAQYAHIFDQILLNIGSVKYAQKWVWKQDQLLLVSAFIWWRLQAHVAESPWQAPEMFVSMFL